MVQWLNVAFLSYTLMFDSYYYAKQSNKFMKLQQNTQVLKHFSFIALQ